jgi:hypothetical protein
VVPRMGRRFRPEIVDLAFPPTHAATARSRAETAGGSSEGRTVVLDDSPSGDYIDGFYNVERCTRTSSTSARSISN